MKSLVRRRVLVALLVGLAAGSLVYALPLERPRAVLPIGYSPICWGMHALFPGQSLACHAGPDGGRRALGGK
jgi:hypothetical protein